ncbi:hypothetical protein ACFSS8_19265 [Paracoccus kondratievae]
MSELRWGDVLCAAIDACCAAGPNKLVSASDLPTLIPEILSVRGDMESAYSPTPATGERAMSDDLIERLRNFTEEDAYAMPWTFGAVVREAADELARLRAEVERLRGQAEINNKMVKKTANDVVRYKTRAERAEAALSDERAHADAMAGALAEATDDLDAWVSHRDDLIRSGYDVDYSAAVSKRGGSPRPAPRPASGVTISDVVTILFPVAAPPDQRRDRSPFSGTLSGRSWS